MDEIIARALLDQATSQELAQLDAWRAESEDNERHYQQVVWLLDGLRRMALPPGPTPRAAELIARVQRERARAARSPRSRARTWAPWSVAAAAAVVLAVQLATRPSSPSSTAVDALEPAEIVTGKGELATVRLHDGSVVRLAPRSRLRLLRSRHERGVWVEGRAFFAVAKDPSRPFRVRTSEGDLVVLGTRFDVRTDSSGLRLAVLEGRVAVIAGGVRKEVASGEATEVRDGLTLPTLKLGNADDVTRWMRRFLAFQSTDLRTVATEIERVYGTRVAFADPSLERETVTAAFTDESLEQVMRILCTVVGVQCAVTDSLITISR
jgi:transmembrane sensor